MLKIVVPLLALVTVVAVVFVLVELHAPSHAADEPPPAAPPSLPIVPATPPPVAVQRGAPPPPVAAAQPAAQPPIAPPPSDPLDVVVRGKTRREWHAYYA